MLLNVPKNGTHFLTMTYKLQEIMAAPLTDPITADLTASSIWVAKAPSTLKKKPLIYHISVIGTGSCPKNIGRFGGALNLPGLVILV